MDDESRPVGTLEDLLGTEVITAAAEEVGPVPTNGASQPQRWEPKQLRARHLEIMRRILEGANYQQIASDMGIHAQTVMLVVTSKLFKEELAKLESSANFDVIRRADSLSNEALDVFKQVMRNSASEARRMRAAREVLDTAGYSKIEKKLVGIVNGEEVIKHLNRMRLEKFNNENNSQSNSSDDSSTADAE